MDTPCEYCGTPLDEDDREDSYIEEAGPGRVTHYADVCRERVHGALRATAKDLTAEREAHRVTRERLAEVEEKKKSLECQSIADVTRIGELESRVESADHFIMEVTNSLPGEIDICDPHDGHSHRYVPTSEYEEMALSLGDTILCATEFVFSTTESHCRAKRNNDGTWDLQQCRPTEKATYGVWGPALATVPTQDAAIKEARRLASGKREGT